MAAALTVCRSIPATISTPCAGLELSPRQPLPVGSPSTFLGSGPGEQEEFDGTGKVIGFGKFTSYHRCRRAKPQRSRRSRLNTGRRMFWPLSRRSATPLTLPMMSAAAAAEGTKFIEPWRFWAIVKTAFANDGLRAAIGAAFANAEDTRNAAPAKLDYPPGGKFSRDDPLFTDPGLMGAVGAHARANRRAVGGGSCTGLTTTFAITSMM